MRNMMYAILATLLAFGTANAADSASSVRINAADWFISYDQSGANRTDKDEFRVGNDGLSAYTDSNTDLGVQISVGAGAMDASLWGEYADTKDYVVGAGLSLSAGPLSIVPRMNWNIDQSAFDTDVTGSVALRGVDAYGRLWWDWEQDDSFLGTTVGLGWTLNVNPTFSIRPYWEMPLDSDWETGDSLVGVNVSVSF